MTNEQFEKLTSQLNILIVLMEKMANAPRPRVPAPRYTADLSQYKSFDWNTVGAEVIEMDAGGLVAAIQWQGRRYSRRSVANKFGKAIMFSLPTGQDSEGANKYETFMIFKELPPVADLDPKVALVIGEE